MEQENYLLKSSLDESNQRLRKLQVEMEYRKSMRQVPKAPFTTSTPENLQQQSGIGESYPHNSKPASVTTKKRLKYCNILPEMQSLAFVVDEQQTAQSRQPRAKETCKGKVDENKDFRNGNSNGDDHELFVQSFEKSNALIQGIFKEKDALQKQLELSRQQLRNKSQQRVLS